MLGDYQEALTYCQQALDMFRDLGNQEGVANVLDSLGYTHQQLGSLSEAAACYRRALDLHRELGGRWGAAEALGHLGDTQHAAGNFAEARAAWEEALVILTDLQHPDADRIRAKLRELGRSLRNLAQLARMFAFRAWNSASVRYPLGLQVRTPPLPSRRRQRCGR